MEEQAPSTTRAEQLKAMLKPWLDELRDGKFDLAKSFKNQPERREDGGIFWMDPRIVGASEKRLEGMELLALVARVDFVLWKDVFKMLCPRLTSATEALIDNLLPTTVGFGVDLPSNDDSCEILVSKSRADLASSRFLETRNKLLAIANAQGVRVTEVPVRVSSSGAVLSKMSSKILQAALMQQRYHQFTADEYKGFVLRTMCVSSEKSSPDLAHFLHLANAADCGVAIESSGVIQPSIEHPTVFVRCMQSIFATDSTSDNSTWAGLKQAKITNGLGAASFASVYSALQASRAVSSVVINPCVDKVQLPDRSRLWSWIAWALFKRESSRGSRIQDLTLAVEYRRMTDIEAMKAILDAPDPLVLLVNRSVAVQSKIVTAQRFTLSDPTHTGVDASELAVYRSRQPISGLAVVECTMPWWTASSWVGTCVG